MYTGTLVCILRTSHAHGIIGTQDPARTLQVNAFFARRRMLLCFYRFHKLQMYATGQ